MSSPSAEHVVEENINNKTQESETTNKTITDKSLVCNNENKINNDKKKSVEGKRKHEDDDNDDDQEDAKIKIIKTSVEKDTSVSEYLYKLNCI